MFSKKEYNAILIDDIFDIKKNINEFCNYFKYLQNNYNHPIIITISNTNNKKINNIIDKCYNINISYSKISFTNSVKNILVKNNLNLTKKQLNDLINNSNYNFNSINENIKYLKHNITTDTNINTNINTDTNINNLTKYLTTQNDITITTNNLIFNDLNLDISELFIKYNTEVNIILYNIIDNIYNLIIDINIILDIYDSILYLNYWEFIKNKLYIFNNDFDIF